MKRPVALVLLALLACKKEPAAQSRPDAAMAMVEGDGGFSVVPVENGPRSTEGPPATPPAPPVRDECSRAAFDGAMREGRKAFAEKRYDDAVSSFEAAVKARPVDARARGELGYAQLHAGRLEQADDNLRVGAELAAGDPPLAAQIWFNRGLAAEKAGKREIARASFAVSDQLSSTAASRAKLEGKSKCPVAIERASSNVGELLIVDGWRGVHASLMERIMGGEDGIEERGRPPPATEAEAKRRACVNYMLSEKVDEKIGGDPCAGPGPWEIQTGLVMFRMFITTVIPLDGGRFAIVPLVRGGGGPRSGTQYGTTKVAGQRLLVVHTNGEAHFVTGERGCITNDLDPVLIDAGGIGYGDVRSLTSNDFVVYDTTSGKPLVEGVVWGEDAGERLKLSATELTIAEGEGTRSCTSAVTKL